MLNDFDADAYVQVAELDDNVSDAADWVIVKVLDRSPYFTVILPLRDEPVVFVDTLYDTVPFVSVTLVIQESDVDTAAF